MSDAFDDNLPERFTGRRVSDSERQQVAEVLSEAAGRGLLDLEEFERRVGMAFAAETSTELAVVTADLPAQPAPTPEPAKNTAWSNAMADEGFRMHFAMWAMVIGFLVGIWLITGAGHPWPFYPAAGWGIGLGSHFMGVAGGKRDDEHDDGHVDRSELRDARHRAHEEARAARRRGQEEARNARRLEREARRREAPPQLPQMPQMPGTAVPPMPSATPAPATSPATNPATTPPAAPTPAADDNSTARREFVVAMFVDVADSTQLNEALGDETWMAIRDRFRAVVREAAEGEDGWEVSISGDGMLCRFPHPDNAARSAIDIQRRLDALRREAGFAPKVRVGIHSGDAMALGDDVIGAVVNLASRVTAAAEPAEILATEHVVDHLRPGIDTESRGLQSLKGVAQPRHLVAIRW